MSQYQKGLKLHTHTQNYTHTRVIYVYPYVLKLIRIPTVEYVTVNNC